jgi:hypothetical protein
MAASAVPRRRRAPKSLMLKVDFNRLRPVWRRRRTWASAVSTEYAERLKNARGWCPFAGIGTPERVAPATPLAWSCLLLLHPWSHEPGPPPEHASSATEQALRAAPARASVASAQASFARPSSLIRDPMMFHARPTKPHSRTHVSSFATACAFMHGTMLLRAPPHVASCATACCFMGDRTVLHARHHVASCATACASGVSARRFIRERPRRIHDRICFMRDRSCFIDDHMCFIRARPSFHS